METIEPGVTATNNNPKCTDIVLFQEAMDNAAAGLPVFNQTCGFSHLVDTTERFQKRHPTECNNVTPVGMPAPPAPLVGDQRRDKTTRRPCDEDLKTHKEASHMKSIGFMLLTETFPSCLDPKETDPGHPPDFHPKNAPACVPDDTTSRTEQDEEFQGFQRDLLNLHHRHEPRSNSIDKFFKSIQRLKKKQDLVAPHPGTGMNHVQLISNAQTQVHQGVGGRKDLVHELKEKWNTKQADLVTTNTTHDQIWEQFKAHCKKELHKLDLQNFTTKKQNESARSVIPPEQASVNLEAEHRLSGIANQLDALSEQQAQALQQQ